jgi:hypothetical protein
MCALSRTLLTQIKVEQKNLPQCVLLLSDWELVAALAFYLICYADAANIARTANNSTPRGNKTLQNALRVVKKS